MTSAEPVTRSPAQLRTELLRCFETPATFAGLLDITDKDNRRTKLRLNPTQRRSLRERTLRQVILKARQIGQTTLELALDVYHFVTKPGSNCVVVCQSIEGHGPRDAISKRIETMLDSLGRLGLVLEYARRSATQWELVHGKRGANSRLSIIEAGASEASAKKKGRADTITRLHLSESAFWEYADETVNALFECVPGPEHGTEIVIESTPNGAAGSFYEQCQGAMSGRTGYSLQFFPWFEDPEYALPLGPNEVVRPETERQQALVERHGVRPEQLKWYQRKLAEKGSQELVDQEYPSDPVTCFISSGRHFFDAVSVALMVAAAEPPKITQSIRATGVRQQVVDRREVPALRVWHEPVRGLEYVVSCDTSEGTGGNAAAAIVLERGSGRHMATLWGQFRPWELAVWAGKLGRKYNNATVVVERNNHGGTVLRSLIAEVRYPPQRIFADRDGKPGWNTTPASRPVMLDALEKAVRARTFQTSDMFVLGQMNTFVVNDKGKAEARKGADDDLVLATGIGWDVVCRHVRKSTEAEEWIP